MPYLEVDRLTVTFEKGTPQEVHALRSVDMSLNRGEIAFILGENGSGKTTLLRAIMGQCRYSGEVRLGGTSLGRTPTWERARRIAYWPQHLESILPNSLTLLELFAIATRRANRKRPWSALRGIKVRAERIIAEVGLPLDSKLDDLVTRLSGGQMAATLFLLSFGWDASLILMDEPTASMDERRRAGVEEYVLRVARTRGDTLLWTTHDIAFALATGDRIIAISQGCLTGVIDRGSSDWNSRVVKTLLGAATPLS